MTPLLDDKVVPLVSPHQYVPRLADVTESSTVAVPAMSEIVISAKLDVSLKGLAHDHAGVFEAHYTDHSSTDFAWTVKKKKKS